MATKILEVNLLICYPHRALYHLWFQNTCELYYKNIASDMSIP